MLSNIFTGVIAAATIAYVIMTTKLWSLTRNAFRLNLVMFLLSLQPKIGEQWKRIRIDRIATVDETMAVIKRFFPKTGKK